MSHDPRERRRDWSREDWQRAQARWARRRGRGWPGPNRSGWRARRGFGCLFGLLFLTVAGSLVAGSALVVSQLGPVPGFIALGAVVAVLVGMGRTLAVTARTLDRLVDATRQVEAGDYTVRVDARGRSSRGLRVVRQLTDGFDTMTERLETDERQRRTLLAEVSHELRTPLTVVQGNLEAILDGVYPPDQAHLGVILDETRILGRLIEDLRTLALSEAGTLTLHTEPTDPDVLVSEVVRSFEPAAAAAQVELMAAIDGDLPIIEIDPVRIREVLANLLTNALRHTPAGGRVTVAGAVDDGRWVRLEVRDTGRGIDPAILPHAFDRFVKGDDSRGSGLGLAIARQLVVAHGGEISAESVPGGGTAIRVRLPLTGE
jgi:two-component system, OmpR family, sensor histidine kinase BaeS